MKKVKIMLTAVVVLAVVGGALAFKVKKSTTEKCLYTTDFTVEGVGSCVFDTKIAWDNLSATGAAKYITTRATNQSDGSCPDIDGNFNCNLFSTTVVTE